MPTSERLDYGYVWWQWDGDSWCWPLRIWIRLMLRMRWFSNCWVVDREMFPVDCPLDGFGRGMELGSRAKSDNRWRCWLQTDLRKGTTWYRMMKDSRWMAFGGLRGGGGGGDSWGVVELELSRRSDCVEVRWGFKAVLRCRGAGRWCWNTAQGSDDYLYTLVVVVAFLPFNRLLLLPACHCHLQEWGHYVLYILVHLKEEGD